MVVETSALVAIVLQEDGYEELVFKIAEDEHRVASAANYLEASLAVFRKRGEEAQIVLETVIAEMEIAIVPVTAAHVRIARDGFLSYGKGMDNKAQLNFGDWFAYALAKQLGEPLLFKGTDFSQTDVLQA